MRRRHSIVHQGTFSIYHYTQMKICNSKKQPCLLYSKQQRWRQRLQQPYQHCYPLGSSEQQQYSSARVYWIENNSTFHLSSEFNNRSFDSLKCQFSQHFLAFSPSFLFSLQHTRSKSCTLRYSASSFGVSGLALALIFSGCVSLSSCLMIAQPKQIRFSAASLTCLSYFYEQQPTSAKSMKKKLTLSMEGNTEILLRIST